MIATRWIPLPRAWLACLLLIGLAGSPFGAATAATFVVNSPDDAGDANPGDGVCQSFLSGGPCTLRAAVQEANALAGPDTIHLPALTITLSILGAEDFAIAGDLDLRDDVSVVGSGFTTVDAGATEGVFQVFPDVTASFSGLNLVGGGASVGIRGAGREVNVESSSFAGMGICLGVTSLATRLEDLDFTDCVSALEIGGVAEARALRVVGGAKAIESGGVVRLDDVTIRDVVGVQGLATIRNAGVLQARGLQVFLNESTGQFAEGLVYNEGRMLLADSLFSQNVSSRAVIYNRSNGSLIATNVEIRLNGPPPGATTWTSIHLRGGWASLEHVNFNSNLSPGPATSIRTELGGVVAVRSSVLDGSVACAGDLPVSRGYNTDGGTSCGLSAPGDLSNTIVSMIPGPGGFRVPPAGSILIGTGPQGCPPLDALGHARPSDTACDRGAVQVGAAIACQNGLDDDGDGLVDLADPGCTSASDPMEIDLSPGDVLVTSVDTGNLFSIDPVSGRREIIAGGAGLASPTGVAQSADGSIYVASLGPPFSAGGPLMRVDPETGAQTLIAWDETTLASVTGMIELANGNLALTSPGIEEIAEVDPTTGAVTTLATGPAGFDPRGISQDPTTGDLFVATSSGTDRLFEIVGGSAVPVALAGGGTVGLPRDIEVEGDQAYITDSGNPDRLIRVDLATGVVTPITTVKTAPRGVDLEADGSVLVADRTANEIVRVDPDTGAQEFFAQGPLIDDAYFMDIVAGPEPCVWTRYASQARFEAAIGPDAEVFDFSSVPLDTNGDAGFSNGHDFGPFTWTSLSLASDVDLFPDPTPDGTLWVTTNYGTPPQAHPGGIGTAGTPENDDDFRLDFATGQQAAGIEIIDSRVEPGERIEFRDDQDQVIASFELPGDASGVPALPDMAGFVGLAVCPGTPLIHSIVVNEGATVGTPQNDNIGFTNVVYVPEPGHLAGLVAGIVLLAGLSRWKREEV